MATLVQRNKVKKLFFKYSKILFYRFEKLNYNGNLRRLVNHFEFHRELTNKSLLIKNLTTFCEEHKLNIFDITPLTFILDIEERSWEMDSRLFVEFFKRHMPIKHLQIDKNYKNRIDIRKKIRYNQNSDLATKSLLQCMFQPDSF